VYGRGRGSIIEGGGGDGSRDDFGIDSCGCKRGGDGGGGMSSLIGSVGVHS
jgi:hypothetical protein